MIKSIDKVIEEAVPATSIKMWKSYNKELYKGLCKAIKEYGESIVDHCRNNWECTLEQRDIEDEIECYTLENGDQVYPVLSRGSVEQVKKLIK